MKEEIHKISRSLFFASAFLLLLWQVKLVETLLSVDFATFGILPHALTGLKGILTAPLIHADFNHLASNSFSMCFLLACMLYIYSSIAFRVFTGIYLISGIMVWLIARPVYHIGSSGLIYGLVSFLFFSGVFRLDVRLLTLSLLMVFMYGGLLWGVFPTSAGISWETHLMGSITGIFYAFYYRTEVVLPQLQPTYLERISTIDFDYKKYTIDQVEEHKIRSLYPDETPSAIEESKKQEEDGEDRKAA